jgi:molybdopterin molybdotransferase
MLHPAREFGYRPGVAEDPYQAWLWKCAIGGSASAGLLAGKTVSFKDHISVAGIPQVFTSQALEGFVPNIDATVVTRVLAAVGRERVLVHPRPRVSVMSVGADLVDIYRTPGNGQIYDVNSYALAAAARDAGADAARVGIVSAEPRQLREVIEIQLSRSEVVVIAGDVAGAAAEDLRGVLSELGEMEVARVAMHPGSVQGFGQLGPDGVPTFLLPANPVSALVVFEVMIRPLIRLSLGKRQPMRRTVRARTLTPVTSVAGRTGFLRGQLLRDEGSGEYLVEPIGESAEGSSHLLASLAEANCLVVVPGPVTEIRAGEYVDVAFLAQRG